MAEKIAANQTMILGNNKAIKTKDKALRANFNPILKCNNNDSQVRRLNKYKPTSVGKLALKGQAMLKFFFYGRKNIRRCEGSNPDLLSPIHSP